MNACGESGGESAGAVGGAPPHDTDELIHQRMRAHDRPDERDTCIGSVSERSRDDVLAGVRASDRLRHDGDADVGSHELDGVCTGGGHQVNRQHGLVCQIREGEVTEVRHERVFRGNDDRRLAVELDRVPIVVGDDVAEEGHVGGAVLQGRERCILRQRHKVEATAGAAFAPDALPLGGRDAGHKGDTQWDGARIGHGLRLPAGPDSAARPTLGGMTDAPREDNRQQPKPKKQQMLSPATAANKLGLYLPATPEEFRAQPISRTDFNEIQANPPEWLTTLRREGPHPRDEVSRRLGVTNSALARAGVSDHMTTTEIHALLDDRPEWLIAEREKHAPGSGIVPGTAIGERPARPEHEDAVDTDDD